MSTKMQKTVNNQGLVLIKTDIVNKLRYLAEDLHSISGQNKYAAALSMAADEIERLRAEVPATVLAYQTSAQ